MGYAADVYTDGSGNYSSGWANGANGGTGFAPWAITCSGAATNAHFQILNAGAGEVNSDKEFAAAAWSGTTLSMERLFLAPLSVGDSFAVDFAVNWNTDGAWKGFVLTAGGQTVFSVYQAADYPGSIWLNEQRVFDLHGLDVMRWTFKRTAAGEFEVSATPRNKKQTVFSQTIAIPSARAALDGICFTYQGPASAQISKLYQTYMYFDNLTLAYNDVQTPVPVEIQTLSVNAAGQLVADIPAGYELLKLMGAGGLKETAAEWAWEELTAGLDYTITGGQLVIETSRKPFRILRPCWRAD